MEAVPRLPMLSFDLLQSAEPVEFGPKLKQFIRSHYNEDPELFNSDINQLEGLRSSAVHPTIDVAGCSTLKRYFCQLHFLASRFPMYTNGAAAVKFSWKDFNTNAVGSALDISLEMSSILYNIGALHTQLGAADNRTTAEGMKMSCTHFQCAAWAFQHICEEYAKAAGLDLSLDLVTFMAKLSLGQAQECILEKSMMDNRKASIIAKVSIQTVDYYKQALKIISGSTDDITDSIGSKQCKKWEKYLKFKISYHGSIALLFQGQQAEEQQKMGERVAFYQASFEKLEEANKLAKGLDNMEAVNEALTFVHDIVEGKRKAAKKENEFIYHEDIPDISALPEVKGASLVKGIPFNVNDSDVSGPDIFARLVPMKAHESSSLYSEEKAKLLRKIVGMIENKDEELETFLSTLQLDDLNKSEGNNLPQELIDRSAALSVKPDAIQNLLDSMNKLSSVYHDVETMLQEIKEMLNEEELHEKEYQETVGKRPPTIAATDLTREAKKYQEAHSKASESNQTLHKAMVMHIANMKLLSLPLKELIKHIPPIVESPEVAAITNEMRHLIDKINEMKQQRIMLSDRLRESIRQDDILKQVVTYNGENLQVLFDSELQKHQPIVSLIEQNLAAQDNILRAVKDSYARYGSTRKGTSEMHRRRETMIASLIASYDAYEDLIAKSAKGLDFYKKLEVNVSKLLQRVKGTCKVQDEEREQIIKNVKNTDLPEVHSSTTLKLKDYLDMKKEFGKLSLDNAPIPPSNPYYKPSGNDQIVNQTWIPGVRPAPVGSEETDATRMDSLCGLYQGKDQTWNAAAYSLNIDDKTKYYQTQSGTATEARYPVDNTSQSMPQDIYPISAYSSVMQNTSSTGYTGPKSNYYNTQNSPSRYINPPHFYTDYDASGVTNYEIPQVPVSSSYSPPKCTSENIAPHQSTSYGSVGYSYPTTLPPQSVSSAYSTTVYSSNQTDVPTAGYITTSQANYQYSTAETDVKVSATEALLPQSQYQAYPAGSDPYKSSNPTVMSQYAQYTNYIPDNSKLSNYSTGVNYGGVQPAAYPTQDTSGYINPQTYQIQRTPGSYATTVDQSKVKYYPTETNIASYNPNLPQNYSTTEGTKLQDYPHVSNEYINQQYQTGTNSPAIYNTNWQQNYDQGNVEYQSNPGQHLQSGNESLYTACQMNNYSLTSSDMYKSVDCQYATDENYGNQYYINQYGTLNGQNEYGLNYGNSATYIQAGAEKQQASTKMTYSNNDAKSSPSAKNSNIDLLAGLDFNISQSPLIPETTPSTIVKTEVDEKTEKLIEEKVENKSVLETSKVKIWKESNPQEAMTPSKDLFVDAEKLNQFSQEVEKYEKFVESLTLKTLNGPTCLDLKWKEILDLQDKSAHLHIISVARCYPMKNRFPDILPYDDSRIELPSTKDDYINASLCKNLSSQTPNFILTQAPLPSTYSDFWAMVFEQQVEVIVCLLSDSELEGHIYWPTEKGQELSMGKLKITLQSSNVRSHWMERIMSLCLAETRVTRVVVHLQFTSWPGSSFPESPGPFLSFTSESINFFNQQRSFTHPVVVHCMSGVGRTGLFCLLVVAISDIQNGKGIPDLVAITGQMSQYRKSSLRDREHLKFAYQAVLYYCQDLLMKRGILTNSSAFDDKKLKEGKCHTRHPSQDFLLGPPTDLSQLQSGIEKLGFECPGLKNESSCRSQSSCSRRDSMTNSCTSSGRTSPSSLSTDVLSNLDPATFSLKLDGSKGKKTTKKRYSTESFTKKSELSLDGFNTESDDPLSRLDPLWTMKK